MENLQPKEKKIKYTPIILRKERNQPVIPEQNPDKNVYFRHSANAGDLIYSLPSIRESVRFSGKRAVIYQVLDEPCKYWGADHPIGDVMFNAYMFRICKPLIEAQDYVERFEVWDCQQATYNIDMIREPLISKELGMPFGDIRQWVMMYYPELQACIGEAWLELEKPVSKTDLIVVNRTSRYRNHKINYEFLQKIDLPIAFIGVSGEYKEFMKEVPRAEFVKTNDLMQAARVIAGSKLFIGNQSSCFAIAEGLGTARVLEVCPEAPNVIPATPNGYLFRDQKGFEALVKLRLGLQQ